MNRLFSRRWRHEHRRAFRTIGVAGASVVLVAGIATTAAAAGGAFRQNNPFGNEQVGQTYANGILLPGNQWIKPIGTRLLVSNGRVLSSAISPNGEFLAAYTWNDFTGFLTVVNLKTGKIVQQVGTGVGADKTIGDGTVSPDGPLWSADGKTLWVSQTSDLLKFSVAAERHRQARHHDHAGDGDGKPHHGQHDGARPALRNGAQPRRVQALRRPQQHEQARRHRHRDERADPADPGRQRAAPGGAGRQPRLRLQRGRPQGHAG